MTSTLAGPGPAVAVPADRWGQIEAGVQSEESAGEVERGDQEVAGGTGGPGPLVADEPSVLTDGRDRGAMGDGLLHPGAAHVEAPTTGPADQDFGATPAEVEGFEADAGGVPQHAEEAAVALAPEVLERVFGRDDRVRVWNTAAFAWRSLCHLEITAQNGRRATCTGSFIGPGVVLTAGHCTFMHGNGGWVRSVRVVPGRNGAAEPFGAAVATRFIGVKGWVEEANPNYDYSVVVLPADQRLGERVGWMGLGNLAFPSLLALRVNSAGYPGDKAYGTQWWNANSILAVSSRRLYYRIDTFGGQSGSPVWRLRNGLRHVIGIHTAGDTTFNGATRITKPVFDNLVRWKSL